MKTLLIAGSGPSAIQYHWPDADAQVMAVSSGYMHVPRMNHFVSLDKAMCFPGWLKESTECFKHVPDWSNKGEWAKFPQVTAWPYSASREPSFNAGEPIGAGPMLKSNVEATRHNSLLFAVQVAPRLGFDRCVFIGCDLLMEGMYPISEALREWYPVALQFGIEWFNASPLSTLCSWMPNAADHEMMRVNEEASV